MPPTRTTRGVAQEIHPLFRKASSTTTASNDTSEVGLDQDICLRCSKHLHESSELNGVERGLGCSRKTKHSKCFYCQKGGKPCEPIPEEFHAKVNKLMTYRGFLDRMDPDDERIERTQAKMTAAVELYIADLDAWKVKEKKRSSNKPGTTMEDYAKLQLEEIKKISESLAVIAKCCRAAFKPAPTEDEDTD